jgi:FMN phosphatase YigB (HAD superfamily)
VTRYTSVFDLDNTLHDAQIQVFLHLHRNMTSYLQVQLSLDEAFANALRREYWQRYGTVLIAAIRHHGTDPRHFLLTTHQFPDLDWTPWSRAREGFAGCYVASPAANSFFRIRPPLRPRRAARSQDFRSF